jgi:CheY-like chemotaxis protein
MLDRLLGEDIEVQVDLGEDLSTLRADGGSIDQVLINLAINARDAMPEGGSLVIQLRNAVIDAEYCKRHSQARPGPYVRVCVSDTGTGMDKEIVPQIFEPFFTTKEVGKGTGLGLSVVYGIVQVHEGWITVESWVGRGTRFEIYLPALVSTMSEEMSAMPAPGALEKAGRQERILLVEDEAEFRERIERLLVRHGYQVEICSTSAEAREACEQLEGGFDLIISDVVLPDGRGHELVAELAENAPQLRVLLITGYADDVMDQSLPLLQKPFAVADLLEKVRQLLP